jgi:pimeloyl-ACP methyl ester carboxylesterase
MGCLQIWRPAGCCVALGGGSWHHDPMPSFEREGISIHYEERGEGFPLLLFAPGGMNSAVEFWKRSPWNPIESLSAHFRVIAMDQRNAGRSRAPIRAGDGWSVYSDDHLALLDHLEIERTHLLGGCIGGPYCLGVIEAAPARVAAAVLQQPIGLSPENRSAFYAMFDAWANALREERSDVDGAALAAFRERMYGGDFVFNVSREFVQSCAKPLLVLMGDDLYHPSAISREIVELARDAELVEQWKEPEHVPATIERVRDFLGAHTP